MIKIMSNLIFKARHFDAEGGTPGLRDPDNPCHEFDAGASAGDCETDGHYLCRKCRHRNPDAAPDFFGADYG